MKIPGVNLYNRSWLEKGLSKVSDLFMPQGSLSVNKQSYLNDTQLRTKIASRIQPDFTRLNNTQKEMICAAQMYIFVNKVNRSLILSDKEKERIIQIVGIRMSRIGHDPNSDIFKIGDYPISHGTVEDHLDRGGNSSAFRGTTETQDPEILEATRNSTKVFHVPITYEAIVCLALKESFESLNRDDLKEELGFRVIPKIYGAESEWIVPRPIPGKNIEKIMTSQGGSTANQHFRRNVCVRYTFDSLAELYEILKSNGCFKK